jgi:hypothetical protein
MGWLGSSASVGILHGGCEQEGEKGGERGRVGAAARRRRIAAG